MTPREINVQIEELVLHGFPANARHQIGTVVKTELGRLLQKHGLPNAWRSNAIRIDAGVIRATRLTNPAMTGAQIAHAAFNNSNNQRSTSQRSHTAP